MLISIYEEKNSANFSAKFTTPITLPKNAELSLLKAYIPRDHDIIIDDTNKQLTIYIHSKDPTAKAVVSIPKGVYGVEEFANELQSTLRTDTLVVNTLNLGQLHSLTAEVKASLDNNQVANDSFSIYLRPQSLYPNFYYELNFIATGNDLNGNTTIEKKTDTDNITITYGNQTLRCEVYTDQAGTAKTGWDNAVIIDKAIGRQWFSPRKHPDYVNDLPPINDTHSVVSFTLGDIQGESASILFGLKQHGTDLDFTSIATQDLDQVINMKGYETAFVFYGDTANGKVAGSFEIYENLAGTFTKLGGSSSSLGTGDVIMQVIPNNTDALSVGCEYYIKFLNGKITKINLSSSPHRYIPANTQVLNPCFGFFNPTGTTNTITDLKIGMDAGYMPTAIDATKGAGKFDEYGKYIKVALGGAGNDNKSLNTVLGFSSETYEEDGTSGAVRVDAISIKNEGDMITNDSKQPYLNLNITNLPITSFTCDNNDSVFGATHDYSRCVACIPRYNQDNGHFDNLSIIFDDNTQTIKLNNKSEIILSSLDIRLQNCDGSYPKDLLTPASFVFKISGDDLN